MEEKLLIHKMFGVICGQCADKTAFKVKKDGLWKDFSYKEIQALSLKVADFLVKNGFKKNDFAAVLLENRVEWGAIYFGILQAGLSCVPLDAQLSSEEIWNLLFDSGAKVIFTSRSLFKSKAAQAIERSAISAVVVDYKGDSPRERVINFSEIENQALREQSFPEVSSLDIASLIYTSGTTGKPKGVALTHANICFNFLSIKELNLIYPSDNFLSILPLHHTYAFMVTLIVPLFTGATVTYCASFKPEELSSVIRESGVTILVGVPQVFSLLHKAIFTKLQKIPFILRPFLLVAFRIELNKRLGSLRLLVSGGARLEPKIAQDLSSLGLKLIEGYGLTETSPIVALNPLQKVKFGSVGKPIPKVEIRIHAPDENGKGEVFVRGPNLMQGYFKQPELTAQAIKDGWFNTGDIGYIDRDGYLFLEGRKEDVMVLSSGKNIYAQELETYYQQSPYVKEICILLNREKVFGYLKDSLYAVIAPNFDYFNQQREANIKEKIRWELDTLGRGLSSYKHIMGFVLTKEELPHTALGKIKRFAVRDKYLGKGKMPEAEKKEVSEAEGQAVSGNTARKIVQYIAKQINRPVYLDSHLEIDLGIDSLTRVELGLGLEGLFHIKIPDEALYSISTVKDAAEKIDSLLAGGKAVQEEAIEKEVHWNQILKKLPSEEIKGRIKLRFGFLESALYWLFRAVFAFIFRLFWFLRIEGKENLPIRGPYLICPNHASYLDGLFVSCGLPFRIAMKSYFVGYQRILEQPLLAWANTIFRMITIDVNSRLAEAMQAVSYVLAHQKIVCIFPEGQRSIGKEVKEFKKGVGILIKELDIPVVPVYIQGSHGSWPRGSRFPRFYPVKVIFGKAVKGRELGVDYTQIAAGLRQRVKDLAKGND